MMHFTSILLLLGAPSVMAICKCTPTDDCWPSLYKWQDLNSTVHGHLVVNEPLAKPCYDGLGKNSTECQKISKVYQDASFRQSSPIGFAYPVIDTCAPTNSSIAGSPVCDLGSASIYSVNATKPADVIAGIKFAQENNVRLVIKNTGHDVRARSQGYGSLSIWMKHIKPELVFQETYKPSRAGYIWDEVYTFAAKHDHIAVGGSAKTVGAIGGYLQGGGHGPASHDFGLAADQVLEFKVVLASGEVVTASASEYVDLFTALRGGGGGTFGVVVEATIKVYPTRPVLKHSLTIGAPNTNISDLVNATVEVLSEYPILSDAGFSGNGQLTRVLGKNSAYSHVFGKMLLGNSSVADSSREIEEAKEVMNKNVVELLRPLNGTNLSVMSTFERFDTFQDYYSSVQHEPQAAINPYPVMVSRFFDKKSLVNNRENLTGMFQAILPESDSEVQAVASLLSFFLVGGGEVLKPQLNSAVHPGWRKTYTLIENFDIPPSDIGIQGLRKVRDYATSKKLKAMKMATPGLGAYLNEADPYDPDWKEAFYGKQYNWLKSVKQKYDPDDTFWCYRCVGYEGWEEITGPTLYGPLCQTK